AVASQGAVLVAAYAQLLGAEALPRQPRRWDGRETVCGSLAPSGDGGWGNRQPAGLWSLAVSVRVRVPQHQPTRPAPFLSVPRKLERARSRDRLGRPVYQPDRVPGEDAA